MTGHHKRRSPVTERLAQTLRTRIREQHYHVNQFLPSIRELAGELGASTRTIARALEELESEGLVERAHGVGVRVLAHGDNDRLRRVAVMYQAYGGPVSKDNTIARIVAAAEVALQQHGYTTTLINTMAAVPEPQQLQQQYAGVLTAMALVNQGPGYYQQLRDLGLPAVVANLELDWDVSASYVDHAGVTAQATETLLAMGHRRIVLLIRSPSMFFYGNTRKGFAAVMAAHGQTVEPGMVWVVPESTELSAYLTVKAQLQADANVTAIIAGRDYLAHGAVQACQDHGLHAGKDISIIGYDDITWPQGRSFLTTFEEPCEALARAAVELLHRQIVTGRHDPARQQIEPRLVLRRSLVPLWDRADDPLASLAMNRESPA